MTGGVESRVGRVILDLEVSDVFFGFSAGLADGAQVIKLCCKIPAESLVLQAIRPVIDCQIAVGL